MAYNSQKGSQHSGDIQYENDPNETQIDFENDSIALKTGGAARITIANTSITSSIGITSSVLLTSDGKLDIKNTSTGHPHIRATSGHFYIRNKSNDKHIRIHLGDDTGTTKFQIRNNSDSTKAHFDSYGNLEIDGALTGSTGLSASFAIKAGRFHGTASYVKFPIQTVSNHYTASISDYTILADTTSANVGVKLPAASLGVAKILNVKKINSSNTVFINTGGGNIDGDATKSLTSLNESLTFHSDGTNWFII